VSALVKMLQICMCPPRSSWSHMQIQMVQNRQQTQVFVASKSPSKGNTAGRSRTARDLVPTSSTHTCGAGAGRQSCEHEVLHVVCRNASAACLETGEFLSHTK